MQLFELENSEPSRLQSLSSWAWNHVSERIAKDWIFLTICGIIMALIAFGMDEGIRLLVEGAHISFNFAKYVHKQFRFLARFWFYEGITEDPFARYFAWVCIPVGLVVFTAYFVHLVAPQAAGNITSLRGRYSLEGFIL